MAFDDAAAADALAWLSALPGIRECVLLSTCNRTELYLVTSGDAGAVEDAAVSFLADHAGGVLDPGRHLYRLRGDDAALHLFTVSAGLDSMILGEPQVLGQVKAAFSLACDAQTTGPITNRLFHFAFRVGKTIRNETGIGKGAVSASTAAAALVETVIGGLAEKTAVLAGTGKIGELAARRFANAGVRLLIANRTGERARDLAGRLGGTAIPFDALSSACADADILIVSVASRSPVIGPADIETAMSRRPDRPLVIVDLGVPRNVAPETGAVPGVRLFNIDDLEDVRLEALDRRRGEAARAEDIVRDMADSFGEWLDNRSAGPVIRDLHDAVEEIRLAELERARNRVDAETYELLDLISRRILRKILHNPVIRVRGAASAAERRRLTESIRELFSGGD